MRALLALPALLLGLALTPAPAAPLETFERADHVPYLDAITPAEAHGFSRLANPARQMIDAHPALDLSDRLPPPRLEGAIQMPLPTHFDPRDLIYRVEVQRVTLSGGPVPRFLKLVIDINCGRDRDLLEMLNRTEGRLLTDEIETIFSPLRFEDVCRISQKNDLRERMIIEFNNALQTQSIRDIYYHTFEVY